MGSSTKFAARYPSTIAPRKLVLDGYWIAATVGDFEQRQGTETKRWKNVRLSISKLGEKDRGSYDLLS